MRMGGAEKSLVNLLNCLSETDDHISLLLFAREGELLQDISKKVKVYSVNQQECAMVLEWRYYHKYLLNPLAGRKLLRRGVLLVLDHIQRLLKIQIIDSWRIIKPVIAQFPISYDLAIGYLEGTADFYALEKVNARKKIAWIHTDFEKNRKNVRRERKYYVRFDRLATITNACKHSLIDQMPELDGKVDVIPNVNDSEYIITQSQAFVPFENQSCLCQIVTVGRLEDEKGIDIAIQVAAILTKSGFDYQWHVYGDGAKKEHLQHQIIENGLNHQFFLEGSVKNPYPYMKNADIIVQPSRYEGKSMVLDEAKILGKAIIVTNYPTAKDQINDHQTGIIIDFDPWSIAKAIKEITENHNLKNALEKNCLIESSTKINNLEAFFEMLKRTM